MIADWPTKIALVESNRSQDYDFFRDIWMPFLRQKGFVPQISEINARAPGRPQLLSTVAGLPISNRKSMSSIIVDDEFLNILFQKRWVQADILVQFTEAIRQVDKIEKLINAELEKGN